MRKLNWKKIIATVTVLATALAFTACGNSDSNPGSGESNAGDNTGKSGEVYRTLDEIKADGTINIGVLDRKSVV